MKKITLIAICLLLCACRSQEKEKMQFEFNFVLNNETYFTLYNNENLTIRSKSRDVSIKFNDSNSMDLKDAIEENKFKMNDFVERSIHLKNNYLKNTDEYCDIYLNVNDVENENGVYVMKCPNNLYVIGEELSDLEKYQNVQLPS